jgi:serine/threonine-protein kinase RsbW
LWQFKLQAVPLGQRKPLPGTPSDARWVVRSQGHAQAMIGARHGVASVVAGESVADGTVTSPSAVHSLRRTFRGEPGQVPLVRDFVSCYLDSLRCPAEAAEDILVCASELATNAVLHSRSGLPGGHFSVEIARTGQSIRVTVADSGGPWSNCANDDVDAECGRGLRVVAALSADTGITGDEAGRMAWFRRRWGAGQDNQPASVTVGHRTG